MHPHDHHKNWKKIHNMHYTEEALEQARKDAALYAQEWLYVRKFFLEACYHVSALTAISRKLLELDGSTTEVADKIREIAKKKLNEAEAWSNVAMPDQQ